MFFNYEEQAKNHEPVPDGLSLFNVILSEHGANCPCCRKFFNREHADRRPRFCEDCGAMLVW